MQYYDQNRYYTGDQEEARQRAVYGGQPLVQNYPTQPYIAPTQQPTVTQPRTLPEEKQPRPNVLPPPPNGGIPPNPFIQPPVPPAIGGNPGAQQNISDSLLQQLQSFIGNPSRYNQAAVDSRFEHQRGLLNKGFNEQRQRIDEDAARRGLFYSTEPTGRKGDLAGQQAQAEAGLLSDLTTDQAKTYSEDMKRAIDTIMGYGGQQFGQQMATAQFNMVQDEQMRNFLISLLGGG